jgi:hypothetical protein
MKMIMKHIGVLFIAIILLLISFYFPNMNLDAIPSPTDNIQNTGLEISEIKDSIEINQDDLQLNHEVVQFKIIFHDSDTINISIHMSLLQKDMQEKAFFIMLTDGTKSLISVDTDMLLLFYVPLSIIDITTPMRRLCFGKPLLYLFSNKINLGLQKITTNVVSAKKNDTWYLTIAVLTKTEGDITIKFKSQHQSMEILQTQRHSNLDFYSSYNNGFSGKYFGIKFFIFGFSLAKNINKQIETKTGSIIHFISAGHTKGDINVQGPNEIAYSDDKRFITTYTYHGNATGQWVFSANGRSFLWKYGIILFYIDIDPHFRDT